MHFGKSLLRLLNERGVSQNELALKIGISRQRVGQMINQPNVQMKTLEKIGKVLKLKPSTLLALAEKEVIDNE